MQDAVDSQLIAARQTYPHLYAFMRLHTMRPLIAQRLREYWMTTLQLHMPEENEIAYLVEHLTVARERYVQVVHEFNELLTEIVILNPHDKEIQEQCLRLVHMPFPAVAPPPVGLDSKATQIWFEAAVVDMDGRIETEHLGLIEKLLRLVC